MPTLHSEHQDLKTASTRLSRLHDRTRAAVEWCVALLILGGVLWLVGSDNLAFAVGAGAITAVAIGALAVDERCSVTPSALALCRTLLSDGAGSPLYNPNLPERELDRALAVVGAGIAPSAHGQVAAATLERDRRPSRTPEQRSAAG